MTQTPNFQLNQWGETDYVRRTDFNADNLKIDTALGTLPRIAVGSYTGDEAETQFISLGFTPKAVLLFAPNGGTYYPSGSHFYYGGLAVTDHPVTTGYQGPASGGGVTYLICEIAEGGFRVHYHYDSNYSIRVLANAAGSHSYLAIG